MLTLQSAKDLKPCKGAEQQELFDQFIIRTYFKTSNTASISPFYYLHQNFGRKLAQTAIVSCERHAILTLRAFIELPADWEL